MATITESDVLQALHTVVEPDLKQDVVTLGMVRNVRIEGGTVSFDIVLTTPACPLKALIKEQAESAVRRHAGAEKATCNFDAQVTKTKRDDRAFAPLVKNFVAIGSGKGGVGKSTVAANVAIGLAASGAKVGLLDADIYGPSVPTLFGLESAPALRGEKIVPIEQYAVKLMSIGVLTKDPVVWRGPMIHSAIRQFLADVDWGDLDYLCIDMPPGTGDVQLTLCQTLPLTGAVIVCTPQDLATQIALKTLKMFQNQKVAILGLVENMSRYQCPHCGARDDIFSTGGAERAAAELQVPFLGAIPLDARIRRGCDAGRPIMAEPEETPLHAAYRRVVEALAAQISIRNILHPPPRPTEVIYR